MRGSIILAALPPVILLAGCDQLPKQEWQPPHVPEFQRFVPLPENHPGDTLSGAMAFDTVTGQLCKTYRWADQGNKLPVCLDLYKTGGFDPDDPLGIRSDLEKLKQEKGKAP